MLKLVERFSPEPNYEELYEQHVQNINDTTVFFEMLDETLDKLDGLAKLPELARNALEEIKYGSAGFVMAHEFVHSMPFFKSPSSNIRQEQQPVLSRPSEICIRERARRACQLWREKACHSGQHTFKEDRSDVTGIHIAWEAFLAEVRGWGAKEAAMKTVIYPELNVTREQLFFYARAIRLCVPYDESQHTYKNRGWDVHSAPRIRINMVHGNMEEFAEAFNCKPGDLMVQRPTCPYF
ncbi:unnamed protein product, partial [Mesorhabditis spiculigera]